MRVLNRHTAENLPKRQPKRNQNVPKGTARFNPNSEEWMNILESKGKTEVAKKNTGIQENNGNGPNKRKKTTAKNSKTEAIKKAVVPIFKKPSSFQTPVKSTCWQLTPTEE